MFKNLKDNFLKGTALTALGLYALNSLAPAPAFAEDWSNHSIETGSVNIDTSIVNTTIITQQTTLVKASGDADIAAGHTVNIIQPSTTSKYIVFDTKADPTTIRGNLNANGEVFIFDQNGVIFTETANINVGSIIASTGTVSDNDLTNNDGRITISDLSSGGAVENSGIITVAEAGLAGLVAPTVTNSGTINARLGKVALASGDVVTLDLYGDKLVEIAVDDQLLGGGLITNSGDINAESGLVVISANIAKQAVENVINMDGIITTSSVSQSGGTIIIDGGTSGNVQISGSVKADSTTQAGSISITAANIGLDENAPITPAPTEITANAVDINNNISSAGNAGSITLSALNDFKLGGTISAQGAANSGFILTEADGTDFFSDTSLLTTGDWVFSTMENNFDDHPFTHVLANTLESSLANKVTLNFDFPQPPKGLNYPDDKIYFWYDDAVSWIKTDLEINLESTSSFSFNYYSHDGDILINSNNTVFISSRNDYYSGFRRIPFPTFYLTRGDLEINANGNIYLERVDSREGNIFIKPAGGLEIERMYKDYSGDIILYTNQPYESYWGNDNSYLRNISSAIGIFENTGTGKTEIYVGPGEWGGWAHHNPNNTNLDSIYFYGNNRGITPGSPNRKEETTFSFGSVGFTSGNLIGKMIIDGFSFNGIDAAIDAGGLPVTSSNKTGFSELEFKNNIVRNTSYNALQITAIDKVSIQDNIFEDVSGAITIFNSHLKPFNYYYPSNYNEYSDIYSYNTSLGPLVNISNNIFRNAGIGFDLGSPIFIQNTGPTIISNNYIEYSEDFTPPFVDENIHFTTIWLYDVKRPHYVLDDQGQVPETPLYSRNHIFYSGANYSAQTHSNNYSSIIVNNTIKNAPGSAITVWGENLFTPAGGEFDNRGTQAQRTLIGWNTIENTGIVESYNNASIYVANVLGNGYLYGSEAYQDVYHNTLVQQGDYSVEILENDITNFKGHGIHVNTPGSSYIAGNTLQILDTSFMSDKPQSGIHVNMFGDFDPRFEDNRESVLMSHDVYNLTIEGNLIQNMQGSDSIGVNITNYETAALIDNRVEDTALFITYDDNNGTTSLVNNVFAGNIRHHGVENIDFIDLPDKQENPQEIIFKEIQKRVFSAPNFAKPLTASPKLFMSQGSSLHIPLDISNVKNSNSRAEDNKDQ